MKKSLRISPWIQIAIIAATSAFGVTACSLFPNLQPATPTTSTTTSIAPSTTTSSTSSPASPTSLFDAVCTQKTSTTLSRPLPSSLNELSGLAASRSHRDIVWTIEDSGNPAAISALNIDGTLMATISLVGTTNTDWEAIALREGPRGDQLVVADIGDNASSRTSITFLFIDEPAIADASIAPEQIVATYSDGPHNAEAVIATTSGIRVVTKYSGVQTIYELDGAVLRPAASLSDNPGLITDAATSADGSLTALRTYGGIRLAKVSTSGVTVALASPGCTMPFAEPQGESITFLPDGSGLVVTSEIAPATLKIIRPAR